MAFEIDDQPWPQAGGLIRFGLVPWDTELFGFPIYQVVPPEAGGWPSEDLVQLLEMLETDATGPCLAVTKVPASDTVLIRTITGCGFYPVETTLEPYRKLKGFEYPQRFPHLCLRPVEQGEIPQMLEIAHHAFRSDRYHLDPNLPQEPADRRYRHWLENALTAGEHVLAFVDTRQDRTLGFCHLRARAEGLVDFSLAGLDPQVQKAGLGVIMYAECLLACQKLGYTQIVTRISVNNTGVLNIYAHLGFHFRRPTLTLHWYSG